MTVQPIPDRLIGFNSRELEVLLEMVEKEKKVCRRSLLATGRWSDRFEQHVDILLSIEDKIKGGVK